MSGSCHNEGPNHALFLAERPRREKLSHRLPHTIVDALRKFELHRCLLRCVRECTGVGDVGPKLETYVPDRGAREYFVLVISRAIVVWIRRKSHHLQDLLKLFQVVCPILAGGASTSTSFVRRSHGTGQHSPMFSDSPVILDPLLD